MHSLLHSVSVAHDAMTEGRLLDAFDILGPDGEAAYEFEHLRQRAVFIPDFHLKHYKEVVKDNYEDEFYGDLERDHDPPKGTFEYDAFIAGFQQERVREHKAYYRRHIKDIESLRWLGPEPRTFDELLKELYTDDRVRESAERQHPFFGLIRRDR